MYICNKGKCYQQQLCTKINYFSPYRLYMYLPYSRKDPSKTQTYYINIQGNSCLFLHFLNKILLEKTSITTSLLCQDFQHFKVLSKKRMRNSKETAQTVGLNNTNCTIPAAPSSHSGFLQIPHPELVAVQT